MEKRLSLIPFKNIFSFRYMKRKIFLWIIFFGLAPILILYLNTYYAWKFENAAWVLGAYFCFLWGVNLYILIRPDVSAWGRGLIYSLFTAFLGVPLLILMQEFEIIQYLHKVTESNIYIYRVMGFVFGVGVLEETCKVLPIILLGIRRGRVVCLKQAIFLGSMSGLGFALAEAVQYTLMYWHEGAVISLSEAYKNIEFTGEQVNTLASYYGGIVIIQIVRFMTLPLFHAIWCGITAWFAASGKLYGGNKIGMTIIGILFSAILHGFYDVYSGSLFGIVIAFFSIMIFMGYLSYSDKLTSC